MKGPINDLVFKELFRKYFTKLCLFAYGMTSDWDHSNTIVSDVFMELRDKEADLAEETIGRLLYKAVWNNCIDHFRKRTREKRNLHRYFLEYSTPEEDPLMTVAMTNECIWEGIGLGFEKLTKPQQTILIRYYFLGEPVNDLARELGKSPSTLYTTKTKGIKGLHEFLKKNGFLVVLTCIVMSHPFKRSKKNLVENSKSMTFCRYMIKNTDNHSTQQYEV